MDTMEKKRLLEMSCDDLHQVILKRELDHGDMERICTERIAAIPRLPLPAGGRWWSFPKAGSYPYGN